MTKGRDKPASRLPLPVRVLRFKPLVAATAVDALPASLSFAASAVADLVRVNRPEDVPGRETPAAEGGRDKLGALEGAAEDVAPATDERVRELVGAKPADGAGLLLVIAS